MLLNTFLGDYGQKPNVVMSQSIYKKPRPSRHNQKQYRKKYPSKYWKVTVHRFEEPSVVRGYRAIQAGVARIVAMQRSDAIDCDDPIEITREEYIKIVSENESKYTTNRRY